MFKMFAFGFETRTKIISPLINRLISKALLVADHVSIRCCFGPLTSQEKAYLQENLNSLISKAFNYETL